eukprot:403354329
MYVGKLLEERFRVEEALEKGGFGQVCKAHDLVTDNYVAVKFNSQEGVNEKETKIMKIIEQNQLKGFPKYYTSGTCKIQDSNKEYIVMQLLSRSIKDIIKSRKNVFSTKTVCQLGINLLHRLEDLHGLGYLHLDIKPDNIMIETTINSIDQSKTRQTQSICTEGLSDNREQQTQNYSNNNTLNIPNQKTRATYSNLVNNDSNSTIQTTKSFLYLIDFGISQRYLENDGITHKKMKNNEEFNGNLIFCSKNMFLEITQSRRDDIISLGYLLLFLFNGQVPWIKKSTVPLKNQYNSISRFKQKMKPEDICQDRAKVLLPYMKYVDSLSYEENPDYGFLRHLLVKVLLEKDLVPDSIYDWDVQKLKKSGVNGIRQSSGQTGAYSQNQYHITNISSTHMLDNDRIVDEHSQENKKGIVDREIRESNEKKTLNRLKQSDRQVPSNYNSSDLQARNSSLAGVMARGYYTNPAFDQYSKSQGLEGKLPFELINISNNDQSLDVNNQQKQSRILVEKRISEKHASIYNKNSNGSILKLNHQTVNVVRANSKSKFYTNKHVNEQPMNTEHDDKNMLGSNLVTYKKPIPKLSNGNNVNRLHPSFQISQQQMKKVYASKSPLRNVDNGSDSNKFFESYIESLNNVNAKYEKQMEFSMSSGGSRLKFGSSCGRSRHSGMGRQSPNMNQNQDQVYNGSSGELKIGLVNVNNNIRGQSVSGYVGNLGDISPIQNSNLGGGHSVKNTSSGIEMSFGRGSRIEKFKQQEDMKLQTASNFDINKQSPKSMTVPYGNQSNQIQSEKFRKINDSKNKFDINGGQRDLSRQSQFRRLQLQPSKNSNPFKEDESDADDEEDSKQPSRIQDKSFEEQNLEINDQLQRKSMQQKYFGKQHSELKVSQNQNLEMKKRLYQQRSDLVANTLIPSNL